MQLHPFQEKIVKECLQKKRGGLSLPMGSGKTIVSLKVALEQKQAHEPILIVASKTLVSSWEQEIKKWYPNESFKTLNLKDNVSKDDNIVITTPTTLMKYYKQYNVEKYLVDKRRDTPFGPEVLYYNETSEPLLGVKYDTFYSIKFSTLIIDEAHNYLNIETLTCRSIVSVCSESKWLLSGTLFCEPKDKNILGFLRMCDLYKGFPNNLPLLTRYIKRSMFKGLESHIVLRKDNDMFVDRPKITKTIVKYDMSNLEHKIYQIYRKFIKQVSDKLSISKLRKDKEMVKNLNATLLGMITKLRLCMISPMLPISKLFIDNIDNGDSSSIYSCIMETFQENSLIGYLQKEENLVSTRIQKIIDAILSHPDERILVFSSFRMSLNYLHMIMKKYSIDRKVFVLDPSMSLEKREKIISEYSSTQSAILLMTYTIGCEGLNLQSSSVVMIMDLWWNEAKSRQAIARVYRYGQKKNTSVYMFVSNTYIEYTMFEKHKDKANISEEILDGNIKTQVKTMSLKKIVDILSEEEFHDDNLIIKSI